MSDPRGSWFHVKDELYFSRRPDGSVRIIKWRLPNPQDPIYEGESPEKIEFVVDAFSWCSVLAHLSAVGDEAAAHRIAEAFHGVR